MNTIILFLQLLPEERKGQFILMRAQTKILRYLQMSQRAVEKNYSTNHK